MRHILLDSLSLGLTDLLTKRLAPLQSFGAGAASVKLLTAERDKIAALPAAFRGRPLADELSIADGRHDGLGAAIWFMLEAYIRHPDTTQAMLDAAKQIRVTFISGLDELGATYEAEATAAKGRKDSLPALKAALDLFAVPGGTLYDWVSDFLAAGHTLDDLLSQRADVKDRKLAAQLRTEAMGTLTRLRKNLAVEVKHDAALPADLDAQVFGYFDLLETKAADAAAEAKKQADAKKKPPPPAPPAPPVG